jgi:glycyl-tRNA synthetase beta chain
VKNISKGVATPNALPSADGVLTEPAEKALAAAIAAGAPTIRAAVERGDYREAFASVASLQPAVAKFFDDVLVMADDERLRAARLGLVAVVARVDS